MPRVVLLFVGLTLLFLSAVSALPQTPTLTVDVNGSPVFTSTSSGASPTINLGDL